MRVALKALQGIAGGFLVGAAHMNAAVLWISASHAASALLETLSVIWPRALSLSLELWDLAKQQGGGGGEEEEKDVLV